MSTKTEMFNNDEKIFNKNDFVYFKSGDDIESAGYKINSILMKEGISPMTTENRSSYSQHGGNVSNLLNDFAVPAGLLLMNQKTTKHYLGQDGGVVNDDLFDKLLNLSGPIKSKKLTRGKKVKKSKKTKRVKS
jgi:hypothetical protein